MSKFLTTLSIRSVTLSLLRYVPSAKLLEKMFREAAVAWQLLSRWILDRTLDLMAAKPLLSAMTLRCQDDNQSFFRRELPQLAREKFPGADAPQDRSCHARKTFPIVLRNRYNLASILSAKRETSSTDNVLGELFLRACFWKPAPSPPISLSWTECCQLVTLDNERIMSCR